MYFQDSTALVAVTSHKKWTPVVNYLGPVDAEFNMYLHVATSGGAYTAQT